MSTMVFDLTLSDSSEKHKCSDVAEAVSGLTSLVRAKTTGTQGGAHSTGSLSSSEADDDEEMEREGDEASAAGGDFLIPQRLTRSGRKRAVPFPLKLMKVLSTKEFSDVIGWLPTGKAFVVHKPKVFAATILPDAFKSAKYSSFTRKLHRWGFARQYRGEETGAFYHVDFQRDRLDLVEKMTCYKPQEPSATKPERAPKAFKKASLTSTYSKKYRGDLPLVPTTTPVTARPPVALRTSNSFSMSIHMAGPRGVDFSMSSRHGQSFNPDLLVALQRQSMLDTDPIWNAAVELEVNRRLNERMNAEATFNKLVLQQKLRGSESTQYLSQGAAAATLRSTPMLPAPRIPAWSHSLNNLTQLSSSMASQAMYGSMLKKDSLMHNNRSITVSPSSAFRTMASIPNIMGSKTA